MAAAPSSRSYGTTIGGQAVHPGESLTQARARMRAGKGTESVNNGPDRPTPNSHNSGTNGPQAAQFRSFLDQYGLGELAPQIDRWIRDGLTWDQVWVQLMDPSTKPGQVVDRIYPELRLTRENGQAPVTIGQVVEWRDNARTLLRNADFPETFYDDPTDFTPWIVAGVHIPEFQERVGMAVDWGKNVPAETRSQLSEIYGVTEGGIAAYVLDPQKALSALKKQQAAAALSGAAVRSGFGGLTALEAERLASLGVTDAQAEQGFGAIGQSRENLNPLAGQQGESISRDVQVGAVAGDLAAVEKIRRAGAQQRGAFGGSGGFSESREGLSGLGSARS